jgi:hypothetical protein
LSDTRWQRSYERFNVQFKITLTFGKSEKVTEGSVLNIGRGGVYVNLDSPPCPKSNETVNFHIQFDDRNYSELKGNGICRWVKKPKDPAKQIGIGIEFSFLDPELYPNLSALLAQLKANEEALAPID